MKRFALTSTAAAFVALGVAAAPAAADMTVTSIVCLDSTYKSAWVPAGTGGDRNLNGAVCVKGKRSVDEFRLITTTVSGVSGGCPTGSTATLSVFAPDGTDANGTGIVCYTASGKGAWSDDSYVLTGLSIQ